MAAGKKQRTVVGRFPSGGSKKEQKKDDSEKKEKSQIKKFVKRSTFAAISDFLILLGALSFFAWMSFSTSSFLLPKPQSYDAPLVNFSEARALLAVKEITGMGSHDLCSNVLEYVTFDTRRFLESIRTHSLPNSPETEMEIEWQNANSGWIPLRDGAFYGKTVVYDSLQNLLVRLSPKDNSTAKESAILVSTHLDAVKFSDGAGDSASNAGVMVELVQNLVFAMNSSINSVIFLWNTGEEEGLLGAHAFITQHPWAKTVKAFVDLEAIGSGGKSTLFQSGPDSWLLQKFASSAPHPSAQILAQDVFSSGVVGSTTDFEVYRSVGGLSGLDFAFMNKPGVYHTRYDMVAAIRPGSLQHLGDNMLAFLKAVLESEELANLEVTPVAAVKEEPLPMHSVYFDILGMRLFVIPAGLAQTLYTTAIAQVPILMAPSLLKAQFRPWLLCLLTLATTLTGAVLCTLAVSLLLPLILYHPFPYIATPWLAGYLFAAPAMAGAIAGHKIGHGQLLAHFRAVKGRESSGEKENDSDAAFLVEWEVERWLLKAGFFLWLTALATMTWLRAGSAYLPFLWLACPAFAYSLFGRETKHGWPKFELATATIVMGIIFPLMVSSQTLFQFLQVVLSLLARVDRNPGELSPLVPSVVVGVSVAVLVTLLVIYVLPIAHRSGATQTLVLLFASATAMGLLLALSETLPVFSTNSPRLLTVVSSYPDLTELRGQRVNWQKLSSEPEAGLPLGVLSVASLTPGPLYREVSALSGIKCGSQNLPDLVTLRPKFACTAEIPLGTNLDGSRVHSLVSELSVLGDHGPRSQGAASWYENLQWWVPDSGEEEVVEGERGQERLLWKGPSPASDPVWEKWPALTKSFHAGLAHFRVTAVGVNSGACRRVNLAVDAQRVKKVSLAAVNGTEHRTYFVQKEATAVDGWHHIAVRVRYEAVVHSHFLLVLHWKKEWSEEDGRQRPLVKIRSDFQEDFPSQVDNHTQAVLRNLPEWTAQFGKASLPLTQAFVDELYIG